jgi:16S rRNA (uracil1498-N3)-methyltransferase
MLEETAKCDLVLFCYEGDGTEPLGRILAPLDKEKVKTIAIVVGSEGGFSLAEAQRAKDAGAVMTGLGKRILRTETASGFVLSCITCFFELI